MLEKADRFNKGKPQWNLIPWRALEYMVRVYEYGATKYSPNNWKKGFPRHELLDCATRHLVALHLDEELDDESKCHHAGHVMANMSMYLHHLDNGTFIPDDRQGPGEKTE